MIKIYRHHYYWYELESISRFIDCEYVNDMASCDFIEVASSEPKPVFDHIEKPIIYSYVREHPYAHDEHLQIQFDSLKDHHDITIFSLGSFEKFAPGRNNVIIDQFELDAYHRLFVRNECGTASGSIGYLNYLFLGGKADKLNRKPLYDLLEKYNLQHKGLRTLFGETASPDNAEYIGDHYLGYPYDVGLYKTHNLSLIAETHYEHNQEFHPTEKTYRAIANSHPFIIASTPYFLHNLKQKGYQTFSNFWSENYDFQLNHTQRLQEIVESLQQALDVKYADIEKICAHNVATLKKNSLNTRKNIITSLYEQL